MNVTRYPKPLPEDDYVDAIALFTVPRYKTSGLSGDEWRFSTKIQLIRKKHVIAERSYRNPETAAAALPWFLLTFREDLNFTPPAKLDALCFNPGCAEKAVSEYELKQEFSACGEGPLPALESTKLIRKFCERHLRRGDCSREDSDDNYIVVSGPGPDQAKPMPTDESPSYFAGVIALEAR